MVTSAPVRTAILMLALTNAFFRMYNFSLMVSRMHSYCPGRKCGVATMVVIPSSAAILHISIDSSSDSGPSSTPGRIWQWISIIADADGLLCRVLDEGKRIDVFMRDQREREHHHRDDAGHGKRQEDPGHGAQPAAAVHERLFLDVPRNGLEEAHQEPGAERHGKGRIHEHQGPERVLEPQERDDARERDEKQRRR